MEIWKDVIGYEGIYEVSNFGNVKSLGNNKSKKEKILKSCVNNNGYLIVVLCKYGYLKSKTVHQIVAESFLNHTPCGFTLVVDHKNHIRTDCRLDNLQIITQRQNTSQKHIKSSSQYTGVSWHKKNKKWVSKIVINGEIKRLGYFEKEVEASEYYENAIIAYSQNKEIVIKIPNFKSKYKGVSFDKYKNKWFSQITINSKRKFLGYFKTEIEAHYAYIKYLQEF